MGTEQFNQRSTYKSTTNSHVESLSVCRRHRNLSSLGSTCGLPLYSVVYKTAWSSWLGLDYIKTQNTSVVHKRIKQIVACCAISSPASQTFTPLYNWMGAGNVWALLLGTLLLFCVLWAGSSHVTMYVMHRAQFCVHNTRATAHVDGDTRATAYVYVGGDYNTS